MLPARSLRFSTAALPEKDRALAVRNLHESGIFAGRIEPFETVEGVPVRAAIRQTMLPDVGIMLASLEGVRQCIRPHNDSRAEDVFIGLNVRGRSEAERRGHRLTVEEGEAVIARRGDAGFAIARPSAARFLGLRMSGARLGLLTRHLDEGVLRRIPISFEPLALLARYAGAIVVGAGPRSPALAALAAEHLYDLLALVVGATRDTWMAAAGRGLRAARLQTVREDARRNLADPQLNAAAVAARHGWSARYIHKLFESEGTSFSRFVLEERLARAHQRLSDPRWQDRTISAIAFELGFGDLSYFNRCFRTRFGVRPSDVRGASKTDRSV